MGARPSVAGHHNTVRVIGDVVRVNRWVGGTVKGLLLLVQAGPEPSLIAVGPGRAALPPGIKEGDCVEVRGRLMSYQLSRRELMLAVEPDFVDIVCLQIQGAKVYEFEPKTLRKLLPESPGERCSRGECVLAAGPNA